MPKLLVFTFAFCILLSNGSVHGQDHDAPPKLENPITTAYLKKHLRKSSPRLVLNPSTEKVLKRKLKSDPVVQNMYQAVKLNANEITGQPLLERNVVGRRLLGTSREFLRRMNMLGLVYRIEKSPELLERINNEVLAVCSFTDWNPSHYLDVAEMAMGVAIALDWTASDLPVATRETALQALIEKGIMPSWSGEGRPGWSYGTNNWNQVCNGGMIAASIAIAEVNPELAAKTIHRALDGLPHSLVEYGPDGVYPEGSTYWSYGTSFSVITIAMLESAFGTDFGMGEYPSFQESAVFRVLCNAPTGWYYNFADCGDKRSENGDITLAWFAKKTGNKLYFEKDRFLRNPADMGKLGRLSGAGLVWLAQYKEQGEQLAPTAWKGEGANPIVIFNGGQDDPNQYYFGGKGGRGTVNHGNMDGGSFIFELDGIRWAIDPGNQSYHALEQTGFNLWGRCQDCERWTLLTKNNYGHSTITVNGALHQVDGLVNLVDFQTGDSPEATFDMTPAFGALMDKATRKFKKDGKRSLVIEDQLEINDSTQMITWQMLTQAEVELVKGGVILKQEGKQVELSNLTHPELTASVISLDPAPLELDRQIDHLKRIEFRYPAYLFKDGTGTIQIRLSGE
ncbi:MAG: hypothetical protein DHS20C17_02720 [Cyclobacteriaceae bacterium]|nr:MAG: hypothetical protein DHS20C17_02720 [Cyclobacteriaceae bacterium]